MYSAFCALLSKEMEDIDRTVNICHHRWSRKDEFSANNSEDILADSLAACYHSYYSGLENLFQSIALEIDESLPKGERWHKKLLVQMATQIPSIRERILSEKSFKHLDEFRAFRHLFRNLYTHNINPERVFLVGKNLRSSWHHVQSDLNNFISYLEKLSCQ